MRANGQEMRAKGKNLVSGYRVSTGPLSKKEDKEMVILNIFDIFNVTYLREAEDVKKRWQENTEELYKKDLHDPDNHNGVITHLEPDIWE